MKGWIWERFPKGSRSRGTAVLLAATVLLTTVGSLRVGVRVKVNNRVLGCVYDPQTVEQTVEEIEQQSSAAMGEHYAVNANIEYAYSVAPVSDFVQSGEMETALADSIDSLDTGYAVVLDGETVGICSTEAEAQQAVKLATAKYAPEKASVSYGQKIEIVEQAAPAQSILSAQALADKLTEGDTPRLTVQTVETKQYTQEMPYGTEKQEIDTMQVGETEVLQNGISGLIEFTVRVTTVNGVKTQRRVLKAETLRKKQDEKLRVGTYDPSIGTGTLIWPVSGAIQTSGFGERWGRMHKGVDLAIETGTEVHAADNGTVITAANDEYGYGYYVKISHNNGMETIYGHNSELLVKVGDVVQQGDVIAKSGSTGRSTGPHCHFEVRVDGTAVDPMGYLPTEGAPPVAS